MTFENIRKIYLMSIVMLISLSFGYFLIEICYRAYLWYGYAIQTNYSITIIDHRNPGINLGENKNIYGPFRKNTSTLYQQFSNDNKLYSKHLVHSNNLGWISHNDYNPIKSDDELRVVVLGSSFAACITNSIPWTDVVQRYLNQDEALLKAVNKKRISVLNISNPGMCIDSISRVLFPIAQRFSPDLIFLNFAVSNFQGRDTAPLPIVEPKLSKKQIKALMEKDFQDAAPHLVINVDGVEIPLGCHSRPYNIKNIDCKVSPIWYIPSGSLSAELDEQKLSKLKSTVAKKILIQRLLLSFKPFALMEILGRPIMPRPSLNLTWFPALIPTAMASPMPDIMLTLTSSEKEDLEVGLKAVKDIKKIHDNLIVAHNVVLWHLKNHHPREINMRHIFMREAEKNNFDIISMDNYMPIEKGEGEWERWFSYDGHFNDYGANVYGKAVYLAIRERLLYQQSLFSKEEYKSQFCKIAEESYFQSMQLIKNNQKREALNELTQAIQHYEKQISDFKTISKEKYGCLVKLYQARAPLYADINKIDQAMSDWEKALSIAPQQIGILLDRGLFLSKTGKIAESIDNFTNALKIDNIPTSLDIQLHVMRGTNYKALGQDQFAIEDFSSILNKTPNDVNILSLRAASYIAVKKYQEALKDYDTILSMNPGNKSMKQARKELLKILN